MLCCLLTARTKLRWFWPAWLFTIRDRYTHEYRSPPESTGGGGSEDCIWRPIFGWDRPVLGKLFEVEVFRFLRERELLSAERMELIRSWRHSGFNVFVGEAIGPEEGQTIGHIARYLLRAPVSLERLWYNPEAGTVTIRPLAGEGNAPVELEVLEFIARLILHIPDFHERQVVYFGAYANASGIRLQHRRARQEDGGPVLWMSPEEEPTPFERRRRIRWQQLIAKVYLENPLLCPECGHGMQIISFITDSPVVDKILRHLKWRPGEAFLPNGRSPPAELKVAESLPSA